MGDKVRKYRFGKELVLMHDCLLGFKNDLENQEKYLKNDQLFHDEFHFFCYFQVRILILVFF